EFQGHVRRPNSVAFSPDGKLLASGGHLDGTVRLWQIPRARASSLQQPRTNEFWRVAFSPESRLLAVAAIDASVHLFDAVTEELVATLKPTNNLTDVSLSWEVRDLPLDFSRDGRLLAAGNGNHRATIWDVAARREMHVLTNHASFVHLVGFAPDGKLLLTASEDKTIRLWDVASGELRSTITAKRPLRFVARFSPDGSFVAYAGSGGVMTFWDVKGQKEQRSWHAHPTEIFGVAFSPDGRTLASSAESEVKLWDVSSGAEIASIPGIRSSAMSLIFTPDGKNLIIPRLPVRFACGICLRSVRRDCSRPP
ncbi:MAG TPA: WD40 repeat domain-containing protein, partial [Methylomirabilota bacterium]|nr:WD40 repeat domain-containing protein [Methylomirabilota bacterium]